VFFSDINLHLCIKLCIKSKQPYMEVAKPTFDIYLDKRRIKENTNKFPVKLKITFLRVRDYISLNYDLNEDEFKKLKGNGIRIEELKILNIKNIGFLEKAHKIAEELEHFDFKEFKKRFLETEFEKQQKAKITSDVYAAITEYANTLMKEGNVKTSKSYTTALTSLKSFKAKLNFNEVTPAFLKAYEKFMLNNDKSNTTIGIYLRNLRAILNTAIENGNLEKKSYPFGKGKYQIPASVNKKKALTQEDIKGIYFYKSEPFSNEDKAKDFWLLSYFCNGINMKDICKLKNKDLKEKEISFVRAKTKNTNRSSQTSIKILLDDKAKKIIEKWRTPNNKKEDYIFDILTNGLEPKRESELIENFIKVVNKHIKRIAHAVGIEENITTYYARHSFSTVLLRDGMSAEYIKEALGHKDIKTTYNYLGSFENETRNEANRALTSFLDDAK
jgi:integrase/recombinase XerD